MEYWGRLDVIYWIKPGEHFKVDDFSYKEVTLVEMTDASKYGWVTREMVGTPSILNIELTVDVAEDLLDWSVLHVGSEKRICKYFDE